MAPLMQRCVGGEASDEEAQVFRQLWQERVRRILLEHGNDPDVFVLRPVETN